MILHSVFPSSLADLLLAFDYFVPFGTNEPKTPAKFLLYGILISSSSFSRGFLSGILGGSRKKTNSMNLAPRGKSLPAGAYPLTTGQSPGYAHLVQWPATSPIRGREIMGNDLALPPSEPALI